MSNPYAPKYAIRVYYPNGKDSGLVTAGNSSPAKIRPFSENDVEEYLASFKKNHPRFLFEKELHNFVEVC